MCRKPKILYMTWNRTNLGEIIGQVILHKNRQILIQLDEALEDIQHALEIITIIEQGEIHVISKFAIGKVTAMSPMLHRQT